MIVRLALVLALGMGTTLLTPACSAAVENPVGGPAGTTWTTAFSEDFDETSSDALLGTRRWRQGWFGDGHLTGTVTQTETALLYRDNITVADGFATFTIRPNVEGLSAPDGVGYRPNLGAAITSDTDQGAVAGPTIRYGYVEARLQLPAATAGEKVWPAWWLNGRTWPSDMEVDVVESDGTDTGCFNVHYGKGNEDTVNLNTSTRCTPINGAANGMHTYGADIRANGVSFYYDGQLVGAYVGKVPAADRYLVLGVSSSGTLTGTRRLTVDYVRGWTRT